MNHSTVRTSLALGTVALTLATAPVVAERYIVEPITDGSSVVEAGAFSQAELDQMLAPIALYPDSLLSQVLVAATYPLEVVEAARWSRQNPRLKGEEAVAAVANRGWDPSVQALVAFPEILAQMDEDLEWTRRLGDAMLYQESMVMDSVQFLRARADAAGHLESTEHVRVIREEKFIVIEPAQPRVVYVPYYDPWVVYGTWWRPAYPPVVWARPSFYFYGHSGFYWGPAVHLTPGFFYTGFYWPQRTVVIVNTPRYYSPPRHRGSYVHYKPGQRWTHNPAHRRGVDYRHREVRERYQAPALRAGPATRWPVEQRTGTARTTDPHRRAPERTIERLDGTSERWDGGRGSDRQAGPTPERTRDRSTASIPASTDSPRLTAGPRTRPTISGTQEQLQQQSWSGRSEGQRPPRADAQPQRNDRAQAASSRSATATTRSVPRAPQAGAPSRNAQSPAAVRGGGPSASPRSAPPNRALQANAPSASSRQAAPPPSRAPQAAAPAPAPRASAPASNRGDGSQARGRPSGSISHASRGQDRREVD